MKKIINTLLNWKRCGKSYPTQIQIHPTNYCNLKCIFCPTRALVKQLNRKKELTREEWLKIILEGNEMGVEEWHICGGGEPFFFKEDALAIMKKIKEYEKYGEVITNGMFFENNVAREIVEMEWDKIYVSLDSPFEKTQNFLRQANCFKKIVRGIKNLVKWKEKLKRIKPEIYFHMVVCNKNFREIPEMVKFTKKMKVNGLFLNALNIWKPSINKLKLKPREEKELEKILKKSLELAKRFGISTNIQEFLNFLFIEKANIMNEAMVKEIKERMDIFSSIACYYPWYNISIFADGRTLPCFILKDEGENVKEKSLKEIWFGEYFNNIRKRFMENRLKEDCSKCNPWNLPKMKEIREMLKKFKSTEFHF